MKQQKETEMAYWRRQYEENYEAAQCVQVNSYAITAKHEFITKRMENMTYALRQISRLGGSQAIAAVLTREEVARDDVRGAANKANHA